MFPLAVARFSLASQTMDPSLEQGKADLRGVPHRARESSSRFADEDLHVQNQQLRDVDKLKHSSRQIERKQQFELQRLHRDGDRHGGRLGQH